MAAPSRPSSVRRPRTAHPAQCSPTPPAGRHLPMGTPRRRTAASLRARVRPTASLQDRAHLPTASHLGKAHRPTGSPQDRARRPTGSPQGRVRRPMASRLVQAGMVRPAAGRPDTADSARPVGCVRHLARGACLCRCRGALVALARKAGQWDSRRAGPRRPRGTAAPVRRHRRGRCRRPSLARRARSGGSSARARAHRLPVTLY